jgi:hypothetical protein
MSIVYNTPVRVNNYGGRVVPAAPAPPLAPIPTPTQEELLVAADETTTTTTTTTCECITFGLEESQLSGEREGIVLLNGLAETHCHCNDNDTSSLLCEAPHNHPIGVYTTTCQSSSYDIEMTNQTYRVVYKWLYCLTAQDFLDNRVRFRLSDAHDIAIEGRVASDFSYAWSTMDENDVRTNKTMTPLTNNDLFIDHGNGVYSFRAYDIQAYGNIVFERLFGLVQSNDDQYPHYFEMTLDYETENDSAPVDVPEGGAPPPCCPCDVQEPRDLKRCCPCGPPPPPQ